MGSLKGALIGSLLVGLLDNFDKALFSRALALHTSFDKFVLRSLGDEAIGGVTPLIYSAALDTPINKGFVKDYRAKYGKVSSYHPETCYTSARCIDDAAKAVRGEVEDREKFLAALRKVEKKDGELWNTVIHTFPAVSQFWKYNPEEFLKQPVYDRNDPWCKFC